MGNNLLRQFIEDAQRTMANFSVRDDEVRPWEHPHNACFPVFEILHWNATNNTPFFKPYISERIVSNRDEELKRDLKRLWKHNRQFSEKYDLPEPDCMDPTNIESRLRDLINKYENSNIPANMYATDIIYRAWLQGGFQKIVDERSVEGLFFEANGIQIGEALRSIADALGLHNWQMEAPNIDGDLTLEEHQWIEYALIHKADRDLQCPYTLIHYPLIIERCWLVGFAYVLKVGDVDKKVEMFDKDKYFRCFSVLVELVAPILKQALLDNVVSNINWAQIIDDNVFADSAANYLRCFNYMNCSSPTWSQIPFKGISKNISVFVPDWVAKQSHEVIIEKELETLRAEIDRRKKEIDAIRNAEEAKRGMLMMGCLAHMAGNALALARTEPDFIQFGQAIIALVEITPSYSKFLRQKFQNEKEYWLDSCIEEALRMSKVYTRGQPDWLPEINVKIQDTLWTNAYFPVKYLRKEYIQMFLYELFKNAVEHGYVYSGQVDLYISSEVIGNELKVYLKNAVHSHRVRKPDDTEYASFLTLAQALHSYLPCIGIETAYYNEAGFDFYVSTLSLGPTKIEVKEGEPIIVHPQVSDVT